MSGYLVYEGDCPRCGDRLGEPDDDGTRWCVCGIGVAAAWWGFEPIDPPTAEQAAVARAWGVDL